MRAPAPWWMNRGVPPTDLNARTGLLTPPGMNRCATSKRAADRGTVSSATCGSAPTSFLREPTRSLLREIRDDEIGAGAAHSQQRLHHGAPFVQPSALGCGLDHRELTTYLIRR